MSSSFFVTSWKEGVPSVCQLQMSFSPACLTTGWMPSNTKIPLPAITVFSNLLFCIVYFELCTLYFVFCILYLVFCTLAFCICYVFPPVWPLGPPCPHKIAIRLLCVTFSTCVHFCTFCLLCCYIFYSCTLFTFACSVVSFSASG